MPAILTARRSYPCWSRWPSIAAWKIPGSPLLYQGEAFDDWYDWLDRNFFSQQSRAKKIPHYLLIVGGPDQVPFGFQSLLNSVANTGRVDFASLDELQQYIGKVLRIERAALPVADREVVMFATDAGQFDATHFSRTGLVEPLANQIAGSGFTTHNLLGDEATKAALQDALTRRKPALVFTASHGLAANKQPLDFKKQYNGAIVCQDPLPNSLQDIFSADDIPLDRPFLEGAVFFQFACFGYGTPAESDFAHWLGKGSFQYTETDFTAALPRRLLAHPRGPVAFIGHLDTAFLSGFWDKNDSEATDHWNARLDPFLTAVGELLKAGPSGYAMRGMSMRYSLCNTRITGWYDRQKRGRMVWDAEHKKELVDNWILRGDAQNYLLLGDPAAHVFMPAA